MSATSRQIWAYVAALAAVSTFIVLYGIPLAPPTWLRALTAAVGITAVSHLLWDNLLWKIPVLTRLAGRVNVNGTWKGRLRSQYHTNTNADQLDCAVHQTEIDVYLVVRQRFSSIHIHQFTSTSSGQAELSDYTKPYNGRAEAVLIYRNDPHQAGALEPHRGTAHYIFDTNAKRIEATYWTNRFSRGTLEFTRHDKRKADTYASASSFFN